jgi:hypothetical protein
MDRVYETPKAEAGVDHAADERPSIQAPEQDVPTRDAWLANSDDCLLRPRRGLSQKVVVSVILKEHAEPSELRDWQSVHGDRRLRRRCWRSWRSTA